MCIAILIETMRALTLENVNHLERAFPHRNVIPGWRKCQGRKG